MERKMKWLRTAVSGFLAALILFGISSAADQTIQYNEKMVGANHPTLSDTLNRLTLIKHNTDGTHKQSSFSVHKNGAGQTITTTTPQQVTWPAELWDTNNNFATDLFTPTIAGKYHFDVNIHWTSFADGVPCYIKIYKNGALYKQSIQISGSAATQSFAASFDVDANGIGDYFNVYVQQDSGVNKNIDGSNSETWWSGYRIID